MKLAGIILIVLGILACIYQFVPVTETKQDAKIGPLSIQHQETHYYPVTIAGVVCIVAGVGCLVLGGRKL
jgi:NADH:ubiquinone oxidoreductase subunit 6 (subunit J)